MSEEEKTELEKDYELCREYADMRDTLMQSINRNTVLGEQNQALRDELREPRVTGTCKDCNALRGLLTEARREIARYGQLEAFKNLATTGKGDQMNKHINLIARIDDAIKEVDDE